MITIQQLICAQELGSILNDTNKIFNDKSNKYFIDSKKSPWKELQKHLGNNEYFGFNNDTPNPQRITRQEAYDAYWKLCAIMEHTSASDNERYKSLNSVFLLLLNAIRFGEVDGKTNHCPTYPETTVCANDYENMFYAIVEAYDFKFQDTTFEFENNKNTFSSRISDIFNSLSAKDSNVHRYCQNMRRVRNIYSHNSVESQPSVNYLVLKHELHSLLTLIITLENKSRKIKESFLTTYNKLLPKATFIIKPGLEDWHSIGLFSSKDNTTPLVTINNDGKGDKDIVYENVEQYRTYWIAVKEKQDSSWIKREIRTDEKYLGTLTYVIQPPVDATISLDIIRNTYEDELFRSKAATNKELQNKFDILSKKIQENKGINEQEAKNLILSALSPLLEMQKNIQAENKASMEGLEKKLLQVIESSKNTDDLRESMQDMRTQFMVQDDRFREIDKHLSDLDEKVSVSESKLQIVEKLQYGTLILLSVSSLLAVVFKTIRLSIAKIIIGSPILAAVCFAIALLLLIWSSLPSLQRKRYVLTSRYFWNIPTLISVVSIVICMLLIPAFSQKTLERKYQKSNDISLLELAYEENLDDAAYLLALADTSNIGKWFKEARLQYSQIQAKDSTDVNSALKLAFMHMKGQGGSIDLNKALTFARRAQKTDRGAGLYALICAYMGNMPEAQKQLKHYEEINGTLNDNSDPFFWFAKIVIDTNDSTLLNSDDNNLQQALKQIYLPKIDKYLDSKDKFVSDEAFLMATSINAYGITSDDLETFHVTPNIYPFITLSKIAFLTSTDARLLLLLADRYRELCCPEGTERLLIKAWHLGCPEAAIILADLIKDRKYEPSYKDEVMEVVKSNQNTSALVDLFFFNRYIQQGKIDEAFDEIEDTDIPTGFYVHYQTSEWIDEYKEKLSYSLNKYIESSKIANNNPNKNQMRLLLIELNSALLFASQYDNVNTSLCLYYLAFEHLRSGIMMDSFLYDETFNFVYELLKLSIRSNREDANNRVESIKKFINIYTSNNPEQKANYSKSLDNLLTKPTE